MKTRKNVLVFTQFVREAEILAAMIPGLEVVHAETPKKEMDRIMAGFRNGTIKAVANVGMLTTGFDKQDLDTVVVARPTMSLGLWYQMVGRAIRTFLGKPESWIIDMGDNLRLFGRVEDLEIKDEGNEKWYISSNGKKLTNEYYGR
jgi:DNA repair protein RadD